MRRPRRRPAPCRFRPPSIVAPSLRSCIRPRAEGCQPPPDYCINIQPTIAQEVRPMLLHLSIENYAIAEQIDIDFQAGMTTLTGETGAGKSILLGALALVLGQRADGAAIHPGARQAEIHALFDLQDRKSTRLNSSHVASSYAVF